MIGKGPSLFGENLGSMMLRLRFRASSQTLSPVLNGSNLDLFQFFMTCLASSWAARALSLAWFSSLIRCLTAGS